MTNLEYIRKLHDLAYQANLADTEQAEDWQTPSMAHSHAQALLDIVSSMMDAEQYQVFLDCFGDFGSFEYNLRHMAKWND